ncbi:MAG: hypothetical protein H6696_03845 [Deferribacteres bacterium]|nr:hypothetical protein [candidate division KSB1 bacterium]MCB9501045.1 hypothetical protein [Deferribacteres bacterium]
MIKNILLLFLLFFLIGCDTASEEAGNTRLQTSPQYKIAYNVLYDSKNDDYEIFAMDLDGSNKKNISKWKGVDWVYYAYKDKIYFISDRDTTHRIYFLYEMDANGNNVRKISDRRLRDSWFASRNDGQEFIINPHNSVDSLFNIIDTQDNLLSRLDTGLPFASDPLFSPDGQKVVFRGGTKKSKREKGFVDELYLINPDGSERTQLTHYPKEDTTAAWWAYKSGPPRWNQKENFISYQSIQNGKYSLYGVTPDGKKQWKLTGNSQEEGWHDWSNDGKLLAIEVFDPNQTQFDIALMDWKEKTLTVLTDTTYKYQQAPVFVESNNMN